MELKSLNLDFSICKVKDYSLVSLEKEFCFIGKTDEERSLVCLTKDVPLNALERDDNWKGFKIQEILDFSLVGILAKISAVLAENGVGIFAVSTFNTDYVFTKTENFYKALTLLSEAGYSIV